MWYYPQAEIGGNVLEKGTLSDEEIMPEIQQECLAVTRQFFSNRSVPVDFQTFMAHREGLSGAVSLISALESRTMFVSMGSTVPPCVQSCLILTFAAFFDFKSLILFP